MSLNRIVIYPGSFSGRTSMFRTICDFTKSGYELLVIEENAMDLVNDSNIFLEDKNIYNNSERNISSELIKKELVKSLF